MFLSSKKELKPSQIWLFCHGFVFVADEQI